MEQNIICFVILSYNEITYKNCLEFLNRLIVPEGIRLQYLRVGGYDGSDTALAFQSAMISELAKAAKYKIYMSDDISIIDSNFLLAVIEAFHADESLGILGVMGWADIPGSEDFWMNEPVGTLIVQEGTEQRAFLYPREQEKVTPVRALHHAILATQYDIPWRAGLLQSARYTALSASLDFQRHGYKAAVLPQHTIWCSISAETLTITEDERIFRAEYAPELEGNFFVEAPGHNYYYLEKERLFNNVRLKIDRHIRYGQLDDALNLLENLNFHMYSYNQFLRDESTESAFRSLRDIMNGLFPDDAKAFTPDENCILFYDGFGLDVRGLAQIYLKALAELNYKILYVTNETAKDNIPTLLRLLETAKVRASVCFLKAISPSERVRELCAIVSTHKPARGILYSTPWDSAGILAFSRWKGYMARYLINLTDHAFWPGMDSFDICIEFRAWGASVSNIYRRIPKERIVIQPYYPHFDRNVKFQGYPFVRMTDDFVVFSGGALYKTIDDTMTYYQVIAWMLRTFPQVKFWYAGTGNDKGLRSLIEAFPGRVFHTAERSDLFQILENVDMYLNTYPGLGGLMTQYSACAGRPPLALVKNPKDGLGGFLLQHDAETALAFGSVDEWENAIQKYITDENYRMKLIQKMNNTVITPTRFRNNLQRILGEGQSDFETIISPVNLSEMQHWYFVLNFKLQDLAAQ
ncbi:MAG: hypothetical protein K5982_05160 [Selenomonadaceae bacterium]|nr:hypothetical protein [Selenomonadaceae bacterium]